MSPQPELGRISRYLVPRLEDVFFCAVFGAVLALGPRLLNGDGDLGRHLTLGKYILASHRIPSQDLFSFTMAGQPFTPHEWLSEVLFAAAHRVLGLDGVVLLSGVVLGLAMSLMFRQTARRCRVPFVPEALSLIAIAATSIHWLARPHLWTMLMVVLWGGDWKRCGVEGRPAGGCCLS